jgi:DNA-binding HxlR family transcriptional regulator
MVSILYASHSGAVRFNEFVQALDGVPPSTLTARLAELEREGIFERAVVDARPPRVEYRLTERGRRLAEVMRALARLAEAR